jgi:hypothetical protein
MAEKIVELVEHPDKAIMLATNGREYAEKYDGKFIIKKWNKVLARLNYLN